MEHDLLFKKVLTTFFFEFLESFLPQVAAYVDRSSIEFFDKETFPSRLRMKISDLVVKAKFRGRDVFFLILVEHQSRPEFGFPKRLFYYFARLSEKYDLDVYPVVIYSHDTPLTPEPTTYEVAFPNKRVLKFDYDVVQLNRMSWRRFINQPNPAATALMSKMSIAAKDRPKVKAQCLRLLTTLRLDPDKTELIYAFVENYLNLTADEDRIYEEELVRLGPDVKETVMDIMSSHRREGIEIGRQEGRQEGKEEVVTILLEQRFSTLPSATTHQLDRLSSDQFDELVRALGGLTSLADLDRWLSERLPD